jgi:hypothetical protein
MLARVLSMTIGPGMRDVATRMADEGYKLSRTLPGFVSATYLIFDEAAGDYGSITVWKSAAEANAAAETLGAWLRQSYGDKLKTPPVVRVAEVYEPA